MKKISKIAAIVAALAFTTNSFAAEITLKLAHTWPTGFPLFATSVDDYAQMVSEMSDGKIEIKIDSRNKHKAPFGIFDFVKSGQYDIGQSFSYYYSGKEPNTLFFTTMPFGMTQQEQTAWLYNGGGLELANEVYGKHGMEVMFGGNTGVQMGGWFRKEIKSVDDIKGLKMRIPGFGGKVIAGIGATVTNLPPGELYQALERGTLDALEWVGPSLDLRMGFHKIAPFYYTGWHEPGTEAIYMFNKEKMDSLPAWATSILKNAAKLTAFKSNVDQFDASANNWESMKAEYPNIKVKNFPQEVVDALRASNEKLLKEEAAKSEMAKKILQSQADYLKKARKWTSISEQAYLNTIADQ